MTWLSSPAGDFDESPVPNSGLTESQMHAVFRKFLVQRNAQLNENVAALERSTRVRIWLFEFALGLVTVCSRRLTGRCDREQTLFFLWITAVGSVCQGVHVSARVPSRDP